MFDKEKAEAIKNNDSRWWPVWRDGDPILESSEDACIYGELIWPDDKEYVKLEALADMETRRCKELGEKGWHTLDICMRITTYIHFLHEARRACRKRNKEITNAFNETGLEL
ncbi:hypothetical protein LCGC14_0811690 [marine sediment metagenome]|uniref:Uncharacterized protein n=1 Tax=marine sediment metagenome TaxID=412755 RepID=A0A0F9S6F0_9ZZZZ